MRFSQIAIYRNNVIYRVYVVAECMLFFVAPITSNTDSRQQVVLTRLLMNFRKQDTLHCHM